MISPMDTFVLAEFNILFGNIKVNTNVSKTYVNVQHTPKPEAQLPSLFPLLDPHSLDVKQVPCKRYLIKSRDSEDQGIWGLLLIHFL